MECPFGLLPQRTQLVTDVEYGFKLSSDDYPPLNVTTASGKICR
jgi:hypothetical protein